MDPELLDPRPDLVQDTELWLCVFRLVRLMAPLAMGDLKGFRCCGGALRLKNGRFVVGRHVEVWPDGDDYREVRERLLGKWVGNGTLQDILSTLPRTFPTAVPKAQENPRVNEPNSGQFHQV